MDEDLTAAAEAAFAAFGPGTTKGARAEAGWFEVGTTVGDGPVFIKALDEGGEQQ